MIDIFNLKPTCVVGDVETQNFASLFFYKNF